MQFFYHKIIVKRSFFSLFLNVFFVFCSKDYIDKHVITRYIDFITKGVEIMKDFGSKPFLSHLIQILFGNFLIAVSVSCFVVPNKILSGGLAGVIVALYPIFPFINISLTISILTVLLFFVGAIFLGKKFVFTTIISTICYPIFLNLLTVFYQNQHLTQNVLLATLYSGLLFGLGTGIVFRVGSSTGGMDVVALLMEKYLHIPLSKACLILDSAAVLLGLTTYSVEAVLIGLIFSYSSSVMVNKALTFGGQKTKSVYIISDQYQEMIRKIDTTLKRGTTIIYAEGSYSKKRKDILLVVVENKQYPKLSEIVYETDPKSFMIIVDAHEVHGNGFTHHVVSSS